MRTPLLILILMLAWSEPVPRAPAIAPLPLPPGESEDTGRTQPPASLADSPEPSQPESTPEVGEATPSATLERLGRRRSRPEVPLEVPPREREGNPRTIDPFFPWRGYCPSPLVESLQWVRRPGPSTITRHDTPGGVPQGTIIVTPGSTVTPSQERVIDLPVRAYRVLTDRSCPVGLNYCPWHDCKYPGEVELKAGELIVPYLETPWRGYACDAVGSEWLCDEEHRWMEDPSMACIAGALEPVIPTPRPGEAHRLGWWLEIGGGWVRADEQFELQVECHERPTRP